MTPPYDAPKFTLPDTNGEIVSLDDFKGRYVIVYFYPRDNTPGCTTEALDFTALKSEFDALDAVVLGISKDSVSSHAKFTTKKSLGITLLSDENGNASESFGVWKEKSMYGKTYFGIERSTFLIDAQGHVVEEWRKVKVANHAQTVLATLKERT